MDSTIIFTRSKFLALNKLQYQLLSKSASSSTIFHGVNVILCYEREKQNQVEIDDPFLILKQILTKECRRVVRGR